MHLWVLLKSIYDPIWNGNLLFDQRSETWPSSLGVCDQYSRIKLIKGKAPLKHSPHGKKTASVLLKPLISGNEMTHH